MAIRTTLLPVILLALASLVHASARPQGVDPPTREGEPHAPIAITSDADLLVPDAIAGNGVRGGMGTAGDPFRISGWRIKSSEIPAVRIEATTAHVLVEDIEIVLDGASERAFAIVAAQRVVLRGVVVTGEGWFGTIERSSVALSDIVVDSTGDGDCLRAGESSLRVERVHFAPDCGSSLASFAASDVEMRNIAHEGPANGLQFAGPAGRVQLESVELARAVRPTPFATTSRSFGSYGILIAADGIEMVELRNVTVSRYTASCFDLRGRASHAYMGGIRATDCGGDGAGAAIRVAEVGEWIADGARLTASDHGVLVDGGRFELARSLVEGNRVGIRAARGEAFVAESTLSANDLHLQAGEEGRILVEDSWLECHREGGCRSFDGDVTVSRPAKAPPIAPLIQSREAALSTWVLLVAVVGGAIAVRSRTEKNVA